MGKLVFSLITKEDDLESFKCNNDSIEKSIRFDSYYLTILKHAYAYSINLDGETLGYYMVYFRNIDLDLLPDAIGEYYSQRMTYCTSIHINYLAIDSRYQHQGIGTHVLRILIQNIMIMSKRYPVRLVTIDALKELHGWYCNIGFSPFCEEDIQNGDETIRMYLDCIGTDNLDMIEEYESV